MARAVEVPDSQAADDLLTLRVEAGRLSLECLRRVPELLHCGSTAAAGQWLEAGNVAARLTGHLQSPTPGVLGLARALERALGADGPLPGDRS